MYISRDTIILLIVIIGFIIFGLVLSSDRFQTWEQSKSFDTFKDWFNFIRYSLFVALVIYLIFFKEW
jgi:hypothetical protein